MDAILPLLSISGQNLSAYQPYIGDPFHFLALSLYMCDDLRNFSAAYKLKSTTRRTTDAVTSCLSVYQTDNQSDQT